METRQKIELAIRAAAACHTLLEMTKIGSKWHAKSIMAEAAKQIMELDQCVESLPEDRR